MRKSGNYSIAAGSLLLTIDFDTYWDYTV